MRILKIFISVLLLIILFACGKKTVPTTAAYTSHEIECLGTDPSGAQRLRVWGEGKDAKAAQESARKKAVEAVLFGHITAGSGQCNSWPVIDNPTTRRTQHEYFAKFFKDGGKFKKFIKAEKAREEKRFTGNDKVVQELEVTVDREGLLKQMTKDKIIR